MVAYLEPRRLLSRLKLAAVTDDHDRPCQPGPGCSCCGSRATSKKIDAEQAEMVNDEVELLVEVLAGIEPAAVEGCRGRYQNPQGCHYPIEPSIAMERRY